MISCLRVRKLKTCKRNLVLGVFLFDWVFLFCFVLFFVVCFFSNLIFEMRLKEQSEPCPTLGIRLIGQGFWEPEICHTLPTFRGRAKSLLESCLLKCPLPCSSTCKKLLELDSCGQFMNLYDICSSCCKCSIFIESRFSPRFLAIEYWIEGSEISYGKDKLWAVCTAAASFSGYLL